MANNKDFIPALGYDFLTGYYDLAIKLTMPEKKFRYKLIEHVNPQANEDILEFGFGTGQNLVIARQKSPATKFTGLDIDPKVKDIAEHRLKSKNFDIPLVLYDGGEFPLSTNSFDKVFSSLVFHQLDTAIKKHCLQEINRVLRPGGTLIIGDWGKPKSKLQRFLFYSVQLLDGFKTTQANVEGKIPAFMADCSFQDAAEIDYLKTKIGTYCYYRGIKSAAS